MLKDLLIKNNAIQLNIDITDWKDALKIVARPLIENNYISERYLIKIIDTTEKTGPYYVFEDEKFALPHARPEDGAYKIGFSLLTLKEPISINGSPLVDIIILLSATDSHSHIEFGLKPIFEMMSNDDTRIKLRQANTKEEVLILL